MLKTQKAPVVESDSDEYTYYTESSSQESTHAKNSKSKVATNVQPNNNNSFFNLFSWGWGSGAKEEITKKSDQDYVKETSIINDTKNVEKDTSSMKQTPVSVSNLITSSNPDSSRHKVVSFRLDKASTEDEPGSIRVKQTEHDKSYSRGDKDGSKDSQQYFDKPSGIDGISSKEYSENTQKHDDDYSSRRTASIKESRYDHLSEETDNPTYDDRYINKSHDKSSQSKDNSEQTRMNSYGYSRSNAQANNYYDSRDPSPARSMLRSDQIYDDRDDRRYNDGKFPTLDTVDFSSRHLNRRDDNSAFDTRDSYEPRDRLDSRDSSSPTRSILKQKPRYSESQDSEDDRSESLLKLRELGPTFRGRLQSDSQDQKESMSTIDGGNTNPPRIFRPNSSQGRRPLQDFYPLERSDSLRSITRNDSYHSLTRTDSIHSLEARISAQQSKVEKLPDGLEVEHKIGSALRKRRLQSSGLVRSLRGFEEDEDAKVKGHNLIIGCALRKHRLQSSGLVRSLRGYEEDEYAKVKVHNLIPRNQTEDLAAKQYLKIRGSKSHRLNDKLSDEPYANHKSERSSNFQQKKTFSTLEANPFEKVDATPTPYSIHGSQNSDDNKNDTTHKLTRHKRQPVVNDEEQNSHYEQPQNFFTRDNRTDSYFSSSSEEEGKEEVVTLVPPPPPPPPPFQDMSEDVTIKLSKTRKVAIRNTLKKTVENKILKNGSTSSEISQKEKAAERRKLSPDRSSDFSHKTSPKSNTEKKKRIENKKYGNDDNGNEDFVLKQLNDAVTKIHTDSIQQNTVSREITIDDIMNEDNDMSQIEPIPNTTKLSTVIASIPKTASYISPSSSEESNYNFEEKKMPLKVNHDNSKEKMGSGITDEKNDTTEMYANDYFSPETPEESDNYIFKEENEQQTRGYISPASSEESKGNLNVEHEATDKDGSNQYVSPASSEESDMFLEDKHETTYRDGSNQYVSPASSEESDIFLEDRHKASNHEGRQEAPNQDKSHQYISPASSEESDTVLEPKHDTTKAYGISQNLSKASSEESDYVVKNRSKKVYHENTNNNDDVDPFQEKNDQDESHRYISPASSEESDNILEHNRSKKVYQNHRQDISSPASSAESDIPDKNENINHNDDVDPFQEEDEREMSGKHMAKTDGYGSAESSDSSVSHHVKDKVSKLRNSEVRGGSKYSPKVDRRSKTESIDASNEIDKKTVATKPVSTAVKNNIKSPKKLNEQALEAIKQRLQMKMQNKLKNSQQPKVKVTDKKSSQASLEQTKSGKGKKQTKPSNSFDSSSDEEDEHESPVTGELPSDLLQRLSAAMDSVVVKKEPMSSEKDRKSKPEQKRYNKSNITANVSSSVSNDSTHSSFQEKRSSSNKNKKPDNTNSMFDDDDNDEESVEEDSELIDIHHRSQEVDSRSESSSPQPRFGSPELQAKFDKRDAMYNKVRDQLVKVKSLKTPDVSFATGSTASGGFSIETGSEEEVSTLESASLDEKMFTKSQDSNAGLSQPSKDEFQDNTRWYKSSSKTKSHDSNPDEYIDSDNPWAIQGGGGSGGSSQDSARRRGRSQDSNASSVKSAPWLSDVYKKSPSSGASSVMSEEYNPWTDFTEDDVLHV